MTFGSPYFLLALLIVPAVLVAAVATARRGARYPVAFTNLAVLADVVAARRRAWRRYVPLAALLVALVFAAGALARPRIHVTKPDRHATIVLLVDVSGSMRAQDVKPTRLGAAVSAMHAFVDHLPSQVKVGLVSFSNRTDRARRADREPSADRRVDRSGSSRRPGPRSETGSTPPSRCSTPHCERTRYVRTPGKDVPGAIVLLSDGTQNQGKLEPLDGAHEARAAGVRIYPVSLGTPEGTVTFGAGDFATTEPVPPDPITMAAIAGVTHGRAYTAQTASSVEQIYRSLGSSIGRTHERVEITPWLAALAAAFLLTSVGLGAALATRIP